MADVASAMASGSSSSVVERKLAILNRAISLNPMSETLISAKMKALAEISDSASVCLQWRSAIAR